MRLQSTDKTALISDPVAGRYERELTSLETLPGLATRAARLLAARATGGFLLTLPATERNAFAGTVLAETCLSLAGSLPDPIALDRAWRSLRTTSSGEPEIPLDEASHAQTRRLWNFAAATEQLLVQGGDDRLTLDPATGLNRYGCAPRPQPHVTAYASCTASSISSAAFAAAGACRMTLLEEAMRQPPAAVLNTAAQNIANALLHHFGLEAMADAMLVASGTDAALLVTALIAAEHPGAPLTSILMSPSETGSGVPHAVQGKHFSFCTASGDIVEKGSPLEGLPGSPALRTIALRDSQARPRPTADIEAECTAAVAEAAARGHAVLHAIDGSKTGLTAPGLATLKRLRAAHGPRLTVIIDACQVRIEPALIKAYIEQGFIVLVTGSKFFAAPGFCGAVLVPNAKRLASQTPAGLNAYATATDGMIARRCPGLLLRWTAALDSMRRFATLPAAAVRDSIDQLGARTRALLMRNPRLRLIEAPRPEGAGWSDRSSVLTFAVRNDAEEWMSADTLRPLYLDLAAAGCQIGQPVCLGSAPFGGLRIAFSADQLIAGDTAQKGLSLVFGKLALLLGD